MKSTKHKFWIGWRESRNRDQKQARKTIILSLNRAAIAGAIKKYD